MSHVMRVGEAGRLLVARLRHGCDLLEGLGAAASNADLRGGLIVVGVGLLAEARLRNCRLMPAEFPITDEHRLYSQHRGPLEILSLSGTISRVGGELHVHCHTLLSYVEEGEVRVVGGHLIEGCRVHSFAEIGVLEVEGVDMERGFDEVTRTLQLFAGGSP